MSTTRKVGESTKRKKDKELPSTSAEFNKIKNWFTKTKKEAK